MSDHEDWLRDMSAYKWIMPFAPWWKRLPIIRHVRAMRLKFKVEQHYGAIRGVFGFRTGYDEWVLYGIWHGLERNECENV